MHHGLQYTQISCCVPDCLFVYILLCVYLFHYLFFARKLRGCKGSEVTVVLPESIDHHSYQWYMSVELLNSKSDVRIWRPTFPAAYLNL
jgi:hypothetical protein